MRCTLLLLNCVLLLSSRQEVHGQIVVSSTESTESSASISVAPNCTEWNASNRLECWLWQLEVAIPAESFSDWITIKVHDMVCTHFKLKDLRSDHQPSSVVHLTVTQLAATCHGKYHSTGGMSGRVQASVSQQASKQALDVAFQVSSTSTVPKRPFQFKTTTCQTCLQAYNVHFLGSFSAKLIQAFSKTIRHYITQALKQHICPLLRQQLDPLMTSYIGQLDDWMQQYLPRDNTGKTENQAVVVSRKLVSNYSSIPYYPADWKMVQWGLGMLNNQLANHLQQGWLFAPEDNHCLDPSCANMFRGLSGWVESIFGESIRIPLPAYFHNFSLPVSLPLDAKAVLSVDHLAIRGLDQLDMLQLFEPNDQRQLLSSVETQQGFHIRAPMSLVIQLPNAHALRETFTLSLSITQLETMATALLQVIDWETTSALQVVLAVQEFAETKNLKGLACLIRTLDQAEISDLIATVLVESVSISRAVKSHSIEDDLDHVINSALEFATSEYTDLITTLIQGLVQGPARHALNDWVRTWIAHHSSQDACPPTPAADGPKWMNFTKFEILNKMNKFLNHSHTRETLNHYMECVGKLLHVPAGNDSMKMNILGASSNPSMVAITKIETQYWDSVRNIQLLLPTNAASLTSKVVWGAEQSPQVTVVLEIKSPQLNGTLNVTGFMGLEAVLGTRLDYNLNVLRNLTVAHLLEQGQCAMIPAVEARLLPDSFLSLGSMIGLNVSADLNQRQVQLSTSDYDNLVPDGAAEVVDWAVEWVRDAANKALEEWIFQSIDTCPGILPDSEVDPDTNEEAESWMDYPLVWIALIMIVLGQGGILWIVKPPLDIEVEDEGSDSNQKEQLSLLEDDMMVPAPLEEDIDPSLLNDMRALDQSLLSDLRDQLEDDHNHCILEEQLQRGIPKSLLATSEIPEIIRYGIPVLIVGTIALLLSSNISTGASVDLSLRLGEKRIRVPGLFEFSLGNTVTDLYQAGIYPLLFLVVVFSGIWPYAKLLWMLYAWIATCNNVHRREERLLTLDALSKFSLVDTYVLVVFLVAFRFHLDVSADLGLDVFVTPVYGFYAFLFATCLSLMLGHGMLYFHRRAQRSYMPSTDSTVAETMFEHDFEVQDDGPRRRLSRLFKFFLLACVFAANMFLAWGFTQKSFTFEFGGLAGMALGDQNRTSYSVLSLGAAIPGSVKNPKSIGILFLQVAYYFYAFVIPMSCLGFLMVLFVKPMTLRRQNLVLVAVEVSNAWSAVEVFVLSIVAALLQISTFASFIIGDKCDLINRLAQDLIGEGEVTCFTVQASVEPNFWYLLVGVVLNSMVVSIGRRLSHVAVEERVLNECNNSLSPGAGEVEVDLRPSEKEVTLVKRMFRLPFGSLLLFAPPVLLDSSEAEDDEANNSGEEEAREQPEWTHWF